MSFLHFLQQNWAELLTHLREHLQLERHGIADSMATEDLREGPLEGSAHGQHGSVPAVGAGHRVARTERDVATCYHLHANCYLQKPVDLDAFAELMRGVEDFWLRKVSLPPRGAANINGR